MSFLLQACTKSSFSGFLFKKEAVSCIALGNINFQLIYLDRRSLSVLPSHHCTNTRPYRCTPTLMVQWMEQHPIDALSSLRALTVTITACRYTHRTKYDYHIHKYFLLGFHDAENIGERCEQKKIENPAGKQTLMVKGSTAQQTVYSRHSQSPSCALYIVPDMTILTIVH